MQRQFRRALLLIALFAGAPAQAQEQLLPTCSGLPDGGGTYDCVCLADAGPGTVWGSNPYTSDSDICTAARHAGAIGAFGGPVHVLKVPGLQDYPATTANGVTTESWGPYDGAITFVSESQAAPPPAPCTTLPDDQARLTCTCEANGANASVWGAGPYTSDSDICTAARFEGVIGQDAATVTVIGLDGLDYYAASTNNGIETTESGSYYRSYVFDWNQKLKP
jgi:hypothetical protein